MSDSRDLPDSAADSQDRQGERGQSFVLPQEQLNFECQVQTRWSDEDNQKVLNNAVYLTLFEEARHEYFTRLGLLTHGSFPFLLAETRLRFLAPGRGGVLASVRMGTTRIGNSSFHQVYRVSDPQGSVWCEGHAVLVCYDQENGGSRPMAPEFRQRLEQQLTGH